MPFGQHLEDVMRAGGHHLEDPLQVVQRHLLVEEVAHGVHEDPAGLLPPLSFAVKSRSSAFGMVFCNEFAEQSPRFAANSRSNGFPFCRRLPALKATARSVPSALIYLGIGSGDGLKPARVTPFARKGFLQLNRGLIAPAFAPGFKCKIRDFVAKSFCI
jgi:hypothetical protein